MANTQLRASKQLYIDNNLDWNAKQIKNLANGTLDTDAATVGQMNALADSINAFQLKGTIDCSANPNYPAANAGHTYRVSVAGKIGGASGKTVAQYDVIECLVDSSASGDEATVGANWNRIPYANTSGSVTSTSSNVTDNAIVRMDSTTGQVIQTSPVTIDDNGSINIPSGQSYKINGTALTAANVGALASTNLVTRETPSGTLNGSNVTFTLANTPISGTEQVYVNGILQDAGAGNDYTISGTTITLLTAPISTDKIRVTYWK